MAEKLSEFQPERPTARVLLFDRDDRILLMKGRLPSAPQRFSTQVGMENTRRDIIALCTAHGADEGLQSFLSTRWLERFAPLAS